MDLGLAESCAITKNHGGHIRVETMENECTKIILDLSTDNGWELSK